MVLKRALDTAAEVHDTYQRIAAWFAALGCLGVGVLLYVGPADIREEIPVHREVGLGFAGFGALFLVALAARGGLARRAKNLLLCVVFALVAGALGLVAEREGRIVYELQRAGVEHTLPVVGTVPKFRGDESYWSVQLRDGLRRIDLEWDRYVKPGTEMTLLVHPEHAGWTAVAPVGSTLLELADARETRWTILGCGIGALVAAFVSLIFLRNTLVGAPAPDEEPLITT